MNDNTKKLIIYIGVFALAIVIILTDRLFTKPKEKEKTISDKYTIIDKIKNIDINNFKSTATLTLLDDAITLEYEKSSDLEIGTKKYHNEKTEYIKNKDKYYTFDNGNFNKLTNFNEFDYDRTFIELENIKKVLSLDGEKRTYDVLDYKVLEITYNIKDLIKIYNKYNNKNIITINNDTSILKIYYKTDLEYIEFDITNLYNIINETEKEKVLLTLTYEETEYEDNTWILEKLN